jgi:hypothetical protein
MNKPKAIEIVGYESAWPKDLEDCLVWHGFDIEHKSYWPFVITLILICIGVWILWTAI